MKQIIDTKRLEVMVCIICDCIKLDGEVLAGVECPHCGTLAIWYGY